MIDLSDVIGKAVGGEDGQLMDKLIDDLRISLSLETQHAWTDTEVVKLALYEMAFAKRTEIVAPYSNLLLKAIQEVQNDIEFLQNEGYKMPTIRMFEE